MNTSQPIQAGSQHFRGGIELHGAGAQGYHGVGQGDILTFQRFDVAHHGCFRTMLLEYWGLQEGFIAKQRFVQRYDGGEVLVVGKGGLVTGCRGKDVEQYIQVVVVRGLVQAQSDFSVREIT